MTSTQTRSSDSSMNKKNARSSARKSSKKAGPGRGWHGDPEGHARAGSQSHKNK